MGWKWPPMTPKGMCAWPSFMAMPGMIVCIGRLPGAMQFGCPRSMRKPKPRLCSITPDAPEVNIEGWHQGGLLKAAKGRVAVFGEAATFVQAIVSGIDTYRVGFVT